MLAEKNFGAPSLRKAPLAGSRGPHPGRPVLLGRSSREAPRPDDEGPHLAHPALRCFGALLRRSAPPESRGPHPGVPVVLGASRMDDAPPDLVGPHHEGPEIRSGPGPFSNSLRPTTRPWMLNTTIGPRGFRARRRFDGSLACPPGRSVVVRRKRQRSRMRAVPTPGRGAALRSAARSGRGPRRDQRYSALMRPQLAGRVGVDWHVLIVAGVGAQPLPAGSSVPV